MKKLIGVTVLALALVAGAGSLVVGQETRPATKPSKSRPAATTQSMEKMKEKQPSMEERMAQMKEMGAMEMPTPSPEHKVIAQSEGVWDARVTLRMSPNAPPMTSKGVEKNEMVGPFWLDTEFTMDFMGQEAKGSGILGYNPREGRLFSVWVDGMNPVPTVMEGEVDLQTGKLMFQGEMFDAMTGEDVSVRMVEERIDKDHRRMKMFTEGPDGEEFVPMEIFYTRRK